MMRCIHQFEWRRLVVYSWNSMWSNQNSWLTFSLCLFFVYIRRPSLSLSRIYLFIKYFHFLNCTNSHHIFFSLYYREWCYRDESDRGKSEKERQGIRLQNYVTSLVYLFLLFPTSYLYRDIKIWELWRYFNSFLADGMIGPSMPYI